MESKTTKKIKIDFNQTPKQMQEPVEKQSDIPAFRALFLSPSNYGKSYLVSEFVIDRLKQGQFDCKRVVIFSKTAKTDPSQQILVKYCKKKYKDFEKHNIFDHIQADFLLTLFEQQKMIKEEHPHKLQQWLVIFDDAISESILTKKKDNVLTDFYCLGRHMGISSIISLQSYRSVLNPTFRNNLTIIAIGRLSSQHEIEDILQNYSNGCGQSKKKCMEKMLQFFEDAIQSRSKHGFLLVHTNKQYSEGKLQRNFEPNKYYDIPGQIKLAINGSDQKHTEEEITKNEYCGRHNSKTRRSNVQRWNDLRTKIQKVDTLELQLFRERERSQSMQARMQQSEDPAYLNFVITALYNELKFLDPQRVRIKQLRITQQDFVNSQI